MQRWVIVAILVSGLLGVATLARAASPDSAEARLAEIERKKAESAQWAASVAALNARLAPIAAAIKADTKASSVEVTWDDASKRVVARGILRSGDPLMFLTAACGRLVSAGYGFVDGTWARVQVEIPPAKKRSNEKWGSVADAVNTTRAWRGCAGPSNEAAAFWEDVASLPGFVDLYQGKPVFSSDVVEVVMEGRSVEDDLRFVVGVCKAASAHSLRIKHVRTHLAPEFPDKVHWRGTLHKC